MSKASIQETHKRGALDNLKKEMTYVALSPFRCSCVIPFPILVVCMARLHPIDRFLVTDYMLEFFDSLLTSSVEPSSPTETTWTLRAFGPRCAPHDDESPTYLTKNANIWATKSSSITTHSHGKLPQPRAPLWFETREVKKRLTAQERSYEK